MHLCNSHNLYLLHMNSNILKKCRAKYVNKVGFVKKKKMHIKYKQDNLHRMIWYTGMCSIMAMGLLYMLALWSNVCAIWIWIQWLFVAGAALMSCHYKTDIISVVSHPRSNSVMSLVLCMVACNGRGTWYELRQVVTNPISRLLPKIVLHSGSDVNRDPTPIQDVNLGIKEDTTINDEILDW